MRHARRTFFSTVLLPLFFGSALAAAQDGYTNTPMSMDGIAKAYMGREIASVMGHQGASWLERPERDAEEGTEKLVPLLGLKPTDIVADIGAGTGFFSFRMAAAVPQGRVYAVDIQQEMLDIIKERKEREGPNVIPLLGSIVDPKLKPDAIDLFLLVDAYHEFSYPREMGLALARALKPGGRIALVEYRGEDPAVPIKAVHKMTEAQARKEMAAVGLRWLRTDESLPWQHVMFFEKPVAAAP